MCLVNALLGSDCIFPLTLLPLFDFSPKLFLQYEQKSSCFHGFQSGIVLCCKILIYLISHSDCPILSFVHMYRIDFFYHFSLFACRFVAHESIGQFFVRNFFSPFLDKWSIVSGGVTTIAIGWAFPRRGARHSASLTRPGPSSREGLPPVLLGGPFRDVGTGTLPV